MNHSVEHNAGSGTPEALFKLPDDPILAGLIQFREDIEFNMLPDPEELDQLVRAVQQDESSTPTQQQLNRRQLIDRNAGLIAATTYPYMGHGIDSRTLLQKGNLAMVFAAMTYDFAEGAGFNDHAVSVMRRALNSSFPTIVANPELEQGKPEEWIVEFIKDPYNPVISVVQKLSDLDTDIQKILPLLHLSRDEIKRESGLSGNAIRRAIRRAKEEWGVSSLAGVALRGLEMGVQFKELRTPQPLEDFTVRERLIGAHLDKSDDEISEIVLLKPTQLAADKQVLLKKMRARNRIEGAIIGRIYKFAPSDTELGNPALREFTPHERQVIELLHLPVETIAEEVGSLPNTITNTLNRLRKKTDTADNVQLARLLLRSGVKFDIPPPKAPLDQAELKIASLLGPTHGAIAESSGTSIWHIHRTIPKMLRNTGAKCEVGLALMLEIYPEECGRAAPDDDPRANVSQAA